MKVISGLSVREPVVEKMLSFVAEKAHTKVDHEYLEE